MEFSNAVNYHIRSTKSQNLLKNISLSSKFTDFETEGSDLNVVENMIARFNKDSEEANDVYKEVEYNTEKDRLLTFISGDTRNNYLIRYNDNLEKPIYKKFSYRELANYYCALNKTSKVRPCDLEGVIVEKSEDGTYKDIDKKTIKSLMDNLKSDVLLNLYNNDLGGVQA